MKTCYGFLGQNPAAHPKSRMRSRLPAHSEQVATIPCAVQKVGVWLVVIHTRIALDIMTSCTSTCGGAARMCCMMLELTVTFRLKVAIVKTTFNFRAHTTSSRSTEGRRLSESLDFSTFPGR